MIFLIRREGKSYDPEGDELRELHQLGLEEKRDRRHEERIQILVASGLLGFYAFIGFDLIRGTALTIFANLIVLLTVLFLLFKLTINSTTPVTDFSWLDKIDRYAPLAYLISIVGTAIVGIIVIASSALDFRLQSLEQIVIPLMMIATFGFVFGVMIVGTIAQYNRAIEKRERIRQELPQALDELVNGDIIDENLRDSTESRFLRVLDDDDRRSMWTAFGGLLGEHQFFRLPISQLNLILSVIERVKINSEYGEFNERDYHTLIDILSSAEEKGPIDN